MTPADPTERLHAGDEQQALRDSETCFRALITAGTLIYRMTPDWRLLDEGDGQTRLDLAQPTERWVDRYVLEEDRGDVLAAIEQAVRTGHLFEQEHRVRLADGSLGWMLSRAVPLFGATGEITGWFGTGTDITEGRRAIEKLQEREADLARVQRIGEVGGLDIDVENGLSSQRSPEYLRLHGLPQDGRRETHDDWISRVHPEDREAAEQNLIAALDGSGFSYENEYRIVRPLDGEVRWIHARADILRNASGRAVRLVGAHLDVTEQKNLQFSLRDSEERLAFLLRLSDALRNIRDPREVQEVASRMLGERFGVNRALFTEIQGQGDTAIAVIHGELVQGVAPVPERLHYAVFARGFCGELWRRGLPVVVEDCETDPRFEQPLREAWRTLDIRSALAVPLLKEGREVVLFGLHHAQPRAWTQTEVTFVTEAVERTWAVTERAIAEDALRSSDQRYRTLFNLMDQGYQELELVRDADGRVVDYKMTIVNPAYERIVGVSGESVLGRPAREALPGMDPAWLETFVRVVETGVPVRLEREEAHLGRWFDLHIIPSGGDRLQVLFDDITERKHAEAALRESEERQAFLLRLADALRPLVDVAEIQAVVSRQLGEYLKVLRAGCGEVNGNELVVRADYAAGVASVAGRYSIDAFGPALAKAYREGGTTIVRDVDTDANLTEAEREQYRTLSVAAHVTVAVRKPGQQAISLGVHSDVPRNWTEDDIALIQEVVERTWAAVARARAEQAVREGEERFRLFVENVREYAFVQTDVEGNITSWNPGAERLFGYSSEEILGRPFITLLPEEDRHDGLFAQEMAKLSQGEQNIDSHTVQRKDGSRFWAEWVTEPVRDNTGTLRGTAKVMRDETERQAAELAVRISLAEKEELLKEVHHRVKNNLQVITSLLNLQAGTVSDRNALALFEEARNRVQSIAAIHELLYRSVSFASISLLTYARQLLPGLIDFYGMGQRVRAEVTGDGHTIELERAVPFGLLLNELVSNALKHAFPDGRHGTIRISISSSGGDFILRVSDDGIGLPAGFDYERASSLGLKLVNVLIRQLRGTIGTIAEEGTTFQARFPSAHSRSSNP